MVYPQATVSFKTEPGGLRQNTTSCVYEFNIKAPLNGETYRERQEEKSVKALLKALLEALQEEKKRQCRIYRYKQ
jgi:hypothetical protein